MEEKKITVFVAGQKLTLITEESEKYVTDIASKVDTAINSLFSGSAMSKERCAVMAALDFCDDEYKARKALNDVKEQIKDYIEDSAKLREENEKLKAQLEKLEKEKQELLTSKKTMIASAVEIKTEEKTEELEKAEISADDDLSFDIEEEVLTPPQPQQAFPVAQVPQPVAPVVQKQTPKSDKKRHNHEHVNPFRQRHMQQKAEQKGYTPVRQYNLFDDENK